MKKKAVLLISITIFIFSVILVMLSIKPVNADPSIIRVPDDYEKIQWAVGNATAGDIINVSSGTYHEQVTVNKSLTLFGENPSTTIIDGFAITDGDYVIKCNASYVNIIGFTIRNGKRGIGLDHSDNITIRGNIIANNSQYGIFLLYSSNNTIDNNTVSNNGDRGIYLRNYSTNNIVSNNTVSGHREWGIYLFNYSSNNVVSSNTILNSGDRGIYLFFDADNNVFNGNVISNNTYGISITNSAGNTLRNNKMNDNKYNFAISALSLGQYIQDIDPSNTVNGKPMYYWVNQADKQIPPGAGYVAVINSKNITVKGQTLTNNAQGVLFAYTTNSTIVNVNASYNFIGIHIVEDLYIPPKSGNNIIKHNILANNDWSGIEFAYSSGNTFTGNTVMNNYYGVSSAFCNNTLYHNNFINNINLTYRNASLSIINIWDNDYPSGGNYWSDYTARGGYDNNGDGIGDVPYVIDDKNQDNYPLMAPVISVDQINISDDRCDVGTLQTVTFHASWVHNSFDVVEGSVYVNSTKYVTNSTGWISFNTTTYDTVGKRVWIITGSVSFHIIWDRINITLSVSDNRINVGDNVTITWSAKYEYDGSAFSGFLTLNNTQTLYSAVGKKSYATLSVSDPVYGLTNFTSNSIHCIWDRIKIVDGGISNTQTNVNQEETVWFKAVYEYDNVAFDGTKGKLYVNGSEMTWSSENNRWEYKYSFNTVGTRIFQVTGVTDNQYALTAINDTVGALSITWAIPFWMQWWFWIAIGAGIIVVVAIYLLKVRKTVKRQN